ncbi:MAG: DUF3048 domain-containing protein [Bacillota bacterium]
MARGEVPARLRPRRSVPAAVRVAAARVAAVRAAAVLLILALAAGAALGAAGCRPQLAIGDPGPGGDPGQGGNPGAGSGGGAPPEPPPPPTTACQLCGLEVVEETVLHRPLAVVIDNHPMARPQSSLNDACLVYEILAEGGITRMVAFYLHGEASAVGPVRSLRHYMLDLVMPLGAVVTHVGGSPQALDDVVRLRPDARNIDAMNYGGAFWYMTGRRSPHSTYTSTSLLRAASRDKGYEGPRLTAPTPKAFDFAADAESASLPAGQSVMRFTLTYAAPGRYSVTYDYDPPTGQWLRYIAGAAHIDASTGRQLRATTVIVQFVPSEVIAGDTEGRLEVHLTGSGEAKVFALGRQVDARWSKAGRTAPIVYTDKQGNPLTLPPGPVWVLIVPPGSRID